MKISLNLSVLTFSAALPVFFQIDEALLAADRLFIKKNPIHKLEPNSWQYLRHKAAISRINAANMNANIEANEMTIAMDRARTEAEKELDERMQHAQIISRYAVLDQANEYQRQSDLINPYISKKSKAPKPRLPKPSE